MARHPLVVFLLSPLLFQTQNLNVNAGTIAQVCDIEFETICWDDGTKSL